MEMVRYRADDTDDDLVRIGCDEYFDFCGSRRAPCGFTRPSGRRE